MVCKTQLEVPVELNPRVINYTHNGGYSGVGDAVFKWICKPRRARHSQLSGLKSFANRTSKTGLLHHFWVK